MHRHLQKRSLTLSGHQTSLALEPAFWAALERCAAAQGQTLGALIAQIDAAKPAGQPLASAARVFALAHASGPAP